MTLTAETERLSKKIYALAYHRAIASLKAKNEEEFARLLEAHRSNLAYEMMTTGTIETQRGVPQHVAGEDGLCIKCGKISPCHAQRVREEKALARERIAAGS